MKLIIIIPLVMRAHFQHWLGNTTIVYHAKYIRMNLGLHTYISSIIN